MMEHTLSLIFIVSRPLSSTPFNFSLVVVAETVAAAAARTRAASIMQIVIVASSLTSE